MISKHIIRTLTLIACLSVFACSAPPIPMEAELAKAQADGLWSAGADTWVPDEYQQYKYALQSSRNALNRETAKFIWFRDYSPVRDEFKRVISTGDGLLQKINSLKNSKSETINKQISSFTVAINSIKSLTNKINEGRLSRRNLIKAEIMLAEAKNAFNSGDYINAEKNLSNIQRYVNLAKNNIKPIVERYADRSQIVKWKKWANETVDNSRSNGNYAVIVSKIDQTMNIYKSGRLLKSYEIGLGRNGSAHKLYSGDGATPEGKYKIIKKIPNSRYYKALLINYPNDDDRKHYAIAKKRGNVPRWAGIGGLVEIHGGGKDGMTQGCISLEDNHMDEVYRIIDIGTPITIVGALNFDNEIAEATEAIR